nr:protein pim1 [Quercus suber]
MPGLSTKKRSAGADQGPSVTKRAKVKVQESAAGPGSAPQRIKNTARSKSGTHASASARRPATATATVTATAAFHNTPPTKKLRVYVFGEGSAGELGLGSKDATDVATPRLNQSLDGVVQAATGGMHAVALTADKKVLTWGVNDNRALGRDTNWDGGMRDATDDSGSDDGDLNPLEATPTAIPSSALPDRTEIIQVAAGDSTTFMLTRDGLVYGCGTFRDFSGNCGFTLDPATGQKVELQDTPRLVPGLKKITSISVGADFALALDHQGCVFAWGSGEQHQLGCRVVERRRLKTLLPHRVELPKKVKIVSIHAGIDHAFAIDAAGDVWAWGLNNFGQTGITDAAGGDDATVIKPTKVSALAGRNMRTVHGGRHHSIGVTAAGECLVWGRMDGAQMGLDVSKLSLDDPTKITVDDRGKPRILLEPTALPIPKCVDATAGPDHCIAVTQDGKAYSWGFNVNYQCGQGTDDDILVAKLINGKAVRDVNICWAGAGGQYSMLASYLD